MRQTLFCIPNFLFEGPLLIAWLLIGALVMMFMYHKEGAKRVSSFVPIYLIVAAAIWLVLPRFIINDVEGNPIGLAVRGYGFFMLLAITAGLGVTWIRCNQLKFPFDPILSLSFWMIVCGIAGARIFYLVQKRHTINIDSPAEIPMKLIDMTEGGLVVYGAVIGGLIAMITIVWLKKLPLLKITDIIAPGMIIGQALGRLGCLMNGCCFGGVCDIDSIGIQFPAGSLPYERQIETGELFGLKTEPVDKELASDELPVRKVTGVQAGSLADQYGIQPDEEIQISTVGGDVIEAIKHPTDPGLFKTSVQEIRKVADPVNYVTVGESMTDLANRIAAGQLDSADLEGALIQNHPAGKPSKAWTEFYAFVTDQVAGQDRKSRQADRLRLIGRAVKWQHKSVLLISRKGHFPINVHDALPPKSLQVHPTQVYSSINAALIFLFLWFYFPFRKSHGEVFALLLILYAVTRFMLEMIRIDEAAVAPTPFTISQLVSFGVLALGVLYFFVSRKFGKLGEIESSSAQSEVEEKLKSSSI